MPNVIQPIQEAPSEVNVQKVQIQTQANHVPENVAPNVLQHVHKGSSNQLNASNPLDNAVENNSVTTQQNSSKLGVTRNNTLNRVANTNSSGKKMTEAERKAAQQKEIELQLKLAEEQEDQIAALLYDEKESSQSVSEDILDAIRQ